MINLFSHLVGIACWLFCLFIKSPTLQAQAAAYSYIDSLQQVIDTTAISCEQANLYLQIATAYQHIDLEKGISYANTSIQMFVTQDCELAYIGYAYGIKGALLIRKGRYQEGLVAIDTGLIYSEPATDTLSTAQLYGHQAGAYYYQGDYSASTKALSNSIALNTKIGNQSGLANNYSFMGVLCETQQDYSCCVAYGKKSLALHHALGNFRGGAITQRNIAFCYKEQAQIDSAILYYEKALKLYQAEQNPTGIAAVRLNQAGLYSDQAQWELALEAIEAYYKLTSANGALTSPITAASITSAVYYGLKAYEKSIDYGKKGLKLAQELGFKRGEYEALKQLSKSYAALQNYQAAYDLNQEAASIQDSIWNENSQAQIQELETKYETIQAKQAKELLTQQLELEQLKTNYSIGIILGLLVLCVLLVLLFNRTRIKAANTALQLKYQLLRSQMNPHFIFNALSAIQSFIYTNKPLVAGDFLASFARLVRTSLEHSNKEYIPLNDEIDWLNNYLEVQSLRFEDQFEYEIEVAPSLKTDVVMIPPMLTQPFVENALEHGFHTINYKGKLRIRFYQEAQQLCITIKDNGVGLLATATEVKEHASMATSITKQRLNFLNEKLLNTSNLTIQPVIPKGTLVTFSVPYYLKPL